jgi:hypothetical protein
VVTFFASLIRRLGLTQVEAATFLDVRPKTVEDWCSGRRNAPPGAYETLHGLALRQQEAAKAIAEILRKSGAAEIEAAVRPAEWPSDGAALVPLVDAWIEAGDGRRVTIVKPGSTPASLGALVPKGRG